MDDSHLRRWDWPSSLLLIFMLQVATARLVVTQWTEFLFFAQTLAALGIILGLALGHSHFQQRGVVLLTIGYSIVLIPWQLTLAIEDALLSEQLASVGGRLLFSLGQFIHREPVEDGLLFVVFISTIAWGISIISGYWWTRHQNYLVAVLPVAVFTLVIHLYDQIFTGRIWFFAIYILLALLLLGQLYYLNNRESWRQRRIFQMQESTFDLTRGMVITAFAFVFIAWTVPASQAGVNSAVRTWKKLTEPWRDVQEWLSHAVEGLKAPTVRRAGDFYGSQLGLGNGNPLSENVIFSVEAPDLTEKQPRYYWRGYVYDYYQNYRWYATGASKEEFFPDNTENLVQEQENEERTTANFTVRTFIPQSLLYTASQPVWVSRRGEVQFVTTDNDERDLLAWRTEPRLSSGEQYRVTAMLVNPSVQQLQKAGAEYPQWVLDRYLQLPENISPRVIELADLITQGLETPYDKAAAITLYLREEIEYTNPLPESPPEGEDPLEWMLFDSKQAFCNYYASAEVLMLRSLGIPARMAVGFAEGDFDNEANVYIVRNLDAHAWPEVYFPEIGWIEFEPTGNQDPLERPDIPEEEDDTLFARGGEDGFLNTLDLNLDENSLERKSDLDEGITPAEEALPFIEEQTGINPLYFLALTIFLLGVLWMLNWQYAVLEKIPVRLQTAYERSGGRSPDWLANWARWTTLTPIERSFETINRSLRLLGEAPVVFATPSERAQLLTRKLPVATEAITILSKQHQDSLYTPKPGDVSMARRASLSIWLYTIQSIYKRILYGTPIE